MGEITHAHIRLDDGTTWPHPEATHTFAERDMASAYIALLMRPWGTEVSVKKLRELRRTLRAEERARKEGER